MTSFSQLETILVWSHLTFGQDHLKEMTQGRGRTCWKAYRSLSPRGSRSPTRRKMATRSSFAPAEPCTRELRW